MRVPSSPAVTAERQYLFITFKGRTLELGLHIADFTWPGGAGRLGPALARHARTAEAAGITRITVMDHFWQIRGVGPAENEMLEAYTALGFLAAHTADRPAAHPRHRRRSTASPPCWPRRSPRSTCSPAAGPGSAWAPAWNEDESVGLGFGFPPVAERFERLEEALQICLQMWC